MCVCVGVGGGGWRERRDSKGFDYQNVGLSNFRNAVSVFFFVHLKKRQRKKKHASTEK